MIDYSPALEFSLEVRAFAITESNESEYKISDEGRSFGLLQIRPMTFQRYYGGVRNQFLPADDDTWTQAQIKCCAAFLLAHNFKQATQSDRDLSVQAWNLGERAVLLGGRRNLTYLSRWKRAYNMIRPADSPGATNAS